MRPDPGGAKMKTTDLMMTTEKLIPTLTVSELLSADAAISNGLDTPGMPSDARKIMLADRRAVRSELERRRSN
jgi:hypothetical protein